MQIELSEEQVLLRDTVRRFAAEVAAPRAKEIDFTGEFPMEFYKKAGELGLTGVCVPEELGGAGMDMVAYCVAIEEVSRVCASSTASAASRPSRDEGTRTREPRKPRSLTPVSDAESWRCRRAQALVAALPVISRGREFPMPLPSTND